MTKPKKVAAKKAATSKQLKTPKSPSKLSQLEAMLRRPAGATLPQLVKALSWQAHSVRGAMSGTLKKKQGFAVTASRVDGQDRVYRIEG